MASFIVGLADLPLISWFTAIPLVSWLILLDIVPYSTLLPGDVMNRWYLHLPLLAAICVPTIPYLWRSKLLPVGYWLFLIWVIVTITYAPDPVASTGRLITWLLVLAAVCKIASQIRNEGDVHAVLEMFLKTCAILIWVDLLAAPFNVGWMFDEQSGFYRFQGFTNEPNEIGALMAVTIPVGILHWGRCTWKPWLAATIIVSILMAILADSRTPFVSTSFGVAAWVTWKYRFKGTFVAAAILIALLLLKSSKSPYISRGMDTYNGRSELWHFEEHKIAQQPIFGYGYATEGLLFVKSRDFRDWVIEYNEHSSLQNGYLSLCISVGVIAAAGFFYLFLRPWVVLFVVPNGNALLKSLFLLIIIPAMVYALSESGIESPKGADGLLVYTSWLLAERYRRGRLRQRSKIATRRLINLRVEELLRA